MRLLDRVSPRPALLALTLLLTVACSASTAVAQSPTNAPAAMPPDGGGGGQSNPGVVQPDPPNGRDQPVDGGPGGPAPVDPDSQWTTVQPRNDLTGIRPQAWDHVSLSADGRTLTVYFYGGVAACYGLAGVNVTSTDGVTTVTVLTGTPPAMGDMACIDLAVAYKTVVQLDQPFLRDGTHGRDQ